MRWQFSWSGIILLACLSAKASGQKFDATSVIAAEVQLDSVVIVASMAGFNVDDFIRLVQEDESLYEAFHNLRSASFNFETNMVFVDKHDETKASYTGSNSQYFDGACRSMQTHAEKWSGDFFQGRKQKHRYYTYSLYDRLFLTHGKICIQERQDDIERANDNAMERHVDELKILIFKPGTRADIPLIGKKTELFSDEMIGLYNYQIESTEFGDIPAYTFTATVKDDAGRENKTVFKALTTTFSKSDFQVLGRTYHLSQNTALYFFDVFMEVDLVQIDTRYYPSVVRYSGTWNIPTKRKEYGSFTIVFSEFK